MQTGIDLLARTEKDLSGSVVTQSTISTPTYSDTGNVNLSSAEGNSLAAEISTSRKSSTTHTVRDNGVESGRDRAHLPDAQYAHPAAEDTTSLRLAQPVTRKQDRASTTPASIFLPPSFEESLDDDSWKTISSKRPEPKKKVLFVGNLRSDVTEVGLKTFIAQRLSTSSPSMTVAISQCSLFKKEQSTSARIVVNARDASILYISGFGLAQCTHASGTLKSTHLRIKQTRTRKQTKAQPAACGLYLHRFQPPKNKTTKKKMPGERWKSCMMPLYPQCPMPARRQSPRWSLGPSASSRRPHDPAHPCYERGWPPFKTGWIPALPAQPQAGHCYCHRNEVHCSEMPTTASYIPWILRASPTWPYRAWWRCSGVDKDRASLQGSANSWRLFSRGYMAVCSSGWRAQCCCLCTVPLRFPLRGRHWDARIYRQSTGSCPDSWLTCSPCRGF